MIKSTHCISWIYLNPLFQVLSVETNLAGLIQKGSNLQKHYFMYEKFLLLYCNKSGAEMRGAFVLTDPKRWYSTYFFFGGYPPPMKQSYFGSYKNIFDHKKSLFTPWISKIFFLREKVGPKGVKC